MIKEKNCHTEARICELQCDENVRIRATFSWIWELKWKSAKYLHLKILTEKSEYKKSCERRKHYKNRANITTTCVSLSVSVSLCSNTLKNIQVASKVTTSFHFFLKSRRRILENRMSNIFGYVSQCIRWEPFSSPFAYLTAAEKYAINFVKRILVWFPSVRV